MEEAFNTLGATVGSIAAKITTGKEAAARYKSKIIEKLDDLMRRIEQFKIDSQNSPVPQLRQKLQELQQNLAGKTEELAASNSKLAELNSKISDLTAQLQSKDVQINAVNRDLENLARERQADHAQNVTDTQAFSDLRNENEALQQDNNQHDAALSELNTQLGTLRTEKAALDQQLLASQQDLSSFVQRIGEINARLAGEIEKLILYLRILAMAVM